MDDIIHTFEIFQKSVIQQKMTYLYAIKLHQTLTILNILSVVSKTFQKIIIKMNSTKVVLVRSGVLLRSKSQLHYRTFQHALNGRSPVGIGSNVWAK